MKNTQPKKPAPKKAAPRKPKPRTTKEGFNTQELNLLKKIFTAVAYHTKFSSEYVPGYRTESHWVDASSIPFDYKSYRDFEDGGHWEPSRYIQPGSKLNVEIVNSDSALQDFQVLAAELKAVINNNRSTKQKTNEDLHRTAEQLEYLEESKWHSSTCLHEVFQSCVKSITSSGKIGETSLFKKPAPQNNPFAPKP